jgi:hypothetical protein
MRPNPAPGAAADAAALLERCRAECGDGRVLGAQAEPSMSCGTLYVMMMSSRWHDDVITMA